MTGDTSSTAAERIRAARLPEGYDLRILDAHHHFWDLEGEGHWPWIQDEYNPDFFLGDYNAMRRTFLAEQYLAATAGWTVLGTVHCEAERSRSEEVAEDEFLDGLHALDPRFPAAVVAHATFLRDDLAQVLAGHAAHPLVKGIRSKPVIATDAAGAAAGAVAGAPGSLQDERWLAGLRTLADHGFSWDLRVPYYHLAEAAEVVATIPGTSVVVNHCGLPLDRSADGLAIWRDGMHRLAALPNTAVKVSELGLYRNVWNRDSNIEIVRETLEIFGHSRAMFASNLPVATLTAPSFDEVMDVILAGAQGATPDQLDDLFHGTASRVYRVELP
ncbi:amidohydrolase family protein [Herbiconiux moechotypicola]|uniref:Amidohydrolase n=1 Tax=Herbiconiux moechotypicola TaxID=637393 RepID=A0ABN3D8M0_9MICO|nr:amidohydrolase family protein [Herbiconiux moechotypicola]MCS5728219.1 amidohydrolase family protein [Herbiconiux moechotypicola]